MRFGRIGAAAMLAGLASTAGHASEAPSTICNRMAVDVADVVLTKGASAFAVSSALKPGECAPMSGIEPGAYFLQFIERAPGRSALCRNALTFIAGKEFAIAPDDGAACSM